MQKYLLSIFNGKNTAAFCVEVLQKTITAMQLHSRYLTQTTNYQLIKLVYIM